MASVRAWIAEPRGQSAKPLPAVTASYSALEREVGR